LSPPKSLYRSLCYHFPMKTDSNQKDLEACLRTFRNLAYKIDEMNTKLTHIIENMREQYIKRKYDEPDDDLKFFDKYDRYDQPDTDDE
jgi:hypothetical protein